MNCRFTGNLSVKFSYYPLPWERDIAKSHFVERTITRQEKLWQITGSLSVVWKSGSFLYREYRITTSPESY